MRDEIWAGIKNAIERGATAEQASESFINAGYNPDEVKEALTLITQGASNIVSNQIGNKNNLPSVTIGDNTKDLEKANMDSKSLPTDSKTLYVPGQSSQPPQKTQQPNAQQPQQPNAQQPQQPSQQLRPATIDNPSIGYIPNNGEDSTRKIKIIILVVLILLLLAILTVSFIYWKDILELFKEFFKS